MKLELCNKKHINYKKCQRNI